MLDGVIARLVRVGEVVRERAVGRFAAGDGSLAERLRSLGEASLCFVLLALAALTTRDMRRAAELARVVPFTGVGVDEVAKADVSEASVEDEPLLLPAREQADGGPCSSNVRMFLDIVPTWTSLLLRRVLVGVSSIARRIDVGLGVRPTTRQQLVR